MSSGFNTDVRVDNNVYHVQTEDRGPSHPVIDTAVYQHGRVVYRRSFNYREFADSSEFNLEALRERVENQHRIVIDDLRGGIIAEELAAAAEQAAQAGGIQVQLLNPQSWLSAGNVSLQLEIARKVDKRPEAGAEIEALIEGASDGSRHLATSDDQGRARIEFPLPPLGTGDLALVIQARKESAKDELRFTMRSREK
jgi:hypothetical protein